tara:strand:+ start:363 stop:1265 length:903 start_codon:yes stop_codon:yes gene_type:complete
MEVLIQKIVDNKVNFLVNETGVYYCCLMVNGNIKCDDTLEINKNMPYFMVHECVLDKDVILKINNKEKRLYKENQIIYMDDFDWGLENEWGKDFIFNEIFINRCYERIFEVEEGDVVVDIGASIGQFTKSILHKNPKKVYCIEPSKKEFKTLISNTKSDFTICINKGIGNIDGEIEVNSDYMLGNEDTMDSITFENFINEYEIEKIDFLKMDCEGGEYDIFTEDNLPWIKNNVRKISGEWHLEDDNQKILFKKFRDDILSQFNNYYIYSLDLYDIKWDLYNDHFLEYYNQVYIYIDNLWH